MSLKGSEIAPAMLLGVLDGDGSRRDAADDDARANDVPAFHFDEGRDAHDGISGGGMGVLQVCAARALPAGRDDDGRHDLSRLQRRGEEIDEELVRRDLPGALRPLRHDGGSKGHENGREVGGRIGVRDGPSDRAAVADLDVADLRGRLRQDRAGLLHEGRGCDLCVRRGRADLERLALRLDAREALDGTEVDEGFGRREPELHGRQQTVPAGQQPRALVLFEQLRRLGQSLRTEVFEAL